MYWSLGINTVFAIQHKNTRGGVFVLLTLFLDSLVSIPETLKQEHFSARNETYMDSMQIKALLAGVCFGLWPLFMNRSGLNGNASTIVLSCVILAFIFPFTVGELWNLGTVKWYMVLGAGIFSALGMLVFNSMLSKATPQSVGLLFVLMIIAQTAVPAVYQTVMSGGISFARGSGFVLAVIAAVLLCKG